MFPVVCSEPIVTLSWNFEGKYVSAIPNNAVWHFFDFFPTFDLHAKQHYFRVNFGLKYYYATVIYKFAAVV
jgi:hypothetical protein